MIFDTHAHYDDDAFAEDREDVLAGMDKAGVGRIVNVAASIPSCKTTLELAQKWPFVYAALGVHPDEVSGLNEETFSWMEDLLQQEKVVAVGEIGLDYHWPGYNEALQKEWFEKQLLLAKRHDLPVIIHSRDAARDTLEIMKANQAEQIGGVVHCYSYSKEYAEIYLNMGFYFGIGGVVTYKNGRKLKAVVEYLPLESIILETDSPYLAPEPHRGHRNDSRELRYVARTIAQLKEISEQEVYEQTWRNACKMYRMDCE